MQNTLSFLVFGDVVGEIGRRAVSKALPLLKEEYSPDSVIINIENMAHGRGISPATFAQAQTWKADVYTTGDHAWDNKPGIPLLENKSYPIVRPANYPPNTPGRGYVIYNLGVTQIAVLNLQGQVFFKNHPNNPFLTLDEMLQIPEIKASKVKLLDFHAEASSEKRAMGWYSDGKISAMWGTHTHVPTADAQVLPQGTGYLTDVGFNGGYNSIIGMDTQGPLKMFLTQTKDQFSPVEQGDLEVNAVLITVDIGSGKTINIAHIRKILKD